MPPTPPTNQAEPPPGSLRRDRSPSPGAVLVTGCSSGIGAAIAGRIAAAGWPVYASARDPEAIAPLARLGCRTLRLDVNDAAEREAAIAAIEAEHGAVAALVNNAGYGQQGPFEEIPLERFRLQIETNVLSIVALIQRVLPAMRARRRGRIVNVSSMGGRLAFPGGAAYHASKYALEAISDVLRFEVAELGVDVVVVEPGPTSTRFGAASLRSMEGLQRVPGGEDYDVFRRGIRTALASTFEGGTPEGASTPEEIAEAVWTALSTERPEPRVVVGETARDLIAMRARLPDREWDDFLATLYPRPTQDPAPASAHTEDATDAPDPAAPPDARARR